MIIKTDYAPSKKEKANNEDRKGNDKWLYITVTFTTVVFETISRVESMYKVFRDVLKGLTQFHLRIWENQVFLYDPSKKIWSKHWGEESNYTVHTSWTSSKPTQDFDLKNQLNSDAFCFLTSFTSLEGIILL